MTEKARVAWANVSTPSPPGRAFVAWARVLIPPGEAVQPPVQPPGHFGGVSAGPAGGPGYDIERLSRDEQLLARLLREDDEILHAIVTIATSGILNGHSDKLH